MSRREIETVSLSFLDLLSCELGGVILLMLIFTAVMYGKYSHRKTLVVYANVGRSSEVKFTAISPYGDRINLETDGTVFLVKERPAFGEWRIVANREEDSTNPAQDELTQLAFYLETKMSGLPATSNWLPFDEATQAANQVSSSFADSRNLIELDVEDLVLLRSGVFSICNSQLTYEQDGRRNPEISKACDTVLKNLAGTQRNDVQHLVAGLFSSIYSSAGIGAEGRPLHNDDLAPVNRSVNFLAILCGLHSQLGKEHQEAKDAATIVIKSIVDEYLYLCRECDLLKHELANGQPTNSGVTHEAVLAYQFSSFANNVRNAAGTLQYLSVCLSKEIDVDGKTVETDNPRESVAIPELSGYSTWNTALYLNSIASNVAQLTPHPDLKLLESAAKYRNGALEMEEAKSTTSATYALIALASLNGQDGRRLTADNRIGFAKSLSPLFETSATNASLQFLENEQSMLLQQAAADALHVVREATTKPTVITALNLHWGGSWKSLPDISLPLSSNDSDTPIVSFLMSHDDLTVGRVARMDGGSS